MTEVEPKLLWSIRAVTYGHLTGEQAIDLFAHFMGRKANPERTNVDGYDCTFQLVGTYRLSIMHGNAGWEIYRIS